MSQQEKNENLFIQVWRNPIFYGLLLADISAEQWQTFTALAVFMNNKGECNPSLSKLKQILGLNSIASVSRRITSLEIARFNGKPLIQIDRSKKKNPHGKWTFTRNRYRLNQEIVTIFAIHEATTVYHEQQMEQLKQLHTKFTESFSFSEKRKDGNITKDKS